MNWPNPRLIGEPLDPHLSRPHILLKTRTSTRHIFWWSANLHQWISAEQGLKFKVTGFKFTIALSDYDYVGPAATITEDEVKHRERTAWNKARGDCLFTLDAYQSSLKAYNLISGMNVPDEYCVKEPINVNE